MTALALLLYKAAKEHRPVMLNGRQYLESQAQSALSGSVDSPNLAFQEDLSDMYFEAVNWLRLAISLDERLPEAHYMLGLFHEHGLSVDINHELAFKHFKRASELGHSHSLTRLGHLYYSGVKRSEFL